MSNSGISCDYNVAPCAVTVITTESPSDPDCSDGLISASGLACCPTTCGQCGGSGCGSAPGGSSDCCGSGVTNSGIYCDDNVAPCIITSASAFGFEWLLQDMYELGGRVAMHYAVVIWITSLLVVSCVCCCYVCRRGDCSRKWPWSKRVYEKVRVDSATDDEGMEMMELM